MAMSEEKKKFAIWEIIVKCVEQVERMKPKSEDYPGADVFCFVYRQLSMARVEALEPEPSEPDELQNLHQRLDRLGDDVETHLGKVEASLSVQDVRLKRLEAGANKLADWCDAHVYPMSSVPVVRWSDRPTTPAPRP